MMTPRYYGPHGNPITLDQWTTLREGTTWERERLRSTVGDVEVSTVWLGLNHQWGDGPPLIFETMVFGGNLDQEQSRYSTRDQAHTGHEQTVARVRQEADEFAALAADEDVREAVALVRSALTAHADAYGIEDPDLGALFDALTRKATTP